MANEQEQQIVSNEQTRLDFRGGMSRLRRQSLNQMYYIQNARPLPDGTLEVRNGQVLKHSVGAASGRVMSLFSSYSANRGLKIYSIKQEDGVTDTVYDGTVALTGVTYKSSDYHSTFDYKDKVFFTNGKALYYHTPGETTLAQVTGSPSPPTGKHMVLYKEKAFIGRDNGDIAWSNTGVFDTLPTADFPTLNNVGIGSTGDGITSLLAGQDFMVAHLAGSYHVMTGLPGDDGDAGDMSWQSNYGIGCVHPRNSTIAGRTVYFLGSDKKIYSLQGFSIDDIDPLGLIQEYLDSITPLTAPYVTLNHIRNELWIFIPQNQSLTSGIQLVYLENLKCWVVFTGINGYAMTHIDDLDRFFIGSAGSGAIWEQDASDLDLGSKIAFELISRNEPMGSFRHNKLYPYCTWQAEIHPEDSLAATYAINNSDTYTAFSSGTPLTTSGNLWGAENWGVSAWGGITGQLGILRPASGVRIIGRELKLKISGNVKAGTRLLNYSVVGDIIARND